MSRIARAVFQEVPSSIDESALAAYGCDVSFISDDSTPPEVLVARQLERTDSPQTRRLIEETFDRLRAEYAMGEMIPHPERVQTRIRQAAAAMGLTLSDSDGWLFRAFDHVNQVLFQHQTLSWVVEAELKIHLHGRGWEAHPTLARFARGPADADAKQAIYRFSKINVASAAYGCVTPQLLEGIAQGGFFLLRFCPADLIEKFYPALAEFCAHWRISRNEELAELATPGIRRLLEFAARTIGIDPLTDWPDFVPHLLATRTARPRSAAVLWPQYPEVAFSSRDELQGMVVKYLYDAPHRRQLAQEMRRTLAAQAQRISVSVNRPAISDASPQAA